jgi:hypothetical protein
MYNVVFRYVMCQDIASGRRGWTAIETQVEIKSARVRARDGALGLHMTRYLHI